MDNVIIESPFVNSLFKCPLCNHVIQSATVINECFHRFCKICIINYFEKNDNKTCPICEIIIINPLQTLKSDLTYQRLLYKIFQRKSSRDQINTKIHVYLEYWNISLDLFPTESSIRLSNCYLECQANTPLIFIEKFLRIKYSISSKLKIEFFYQSLLLNTNNEQLSDICYCFDTQNSSLDIRFIVSPYGYKSILKRIRQSKQKIENNSTLKVKICRSQSSTNDWFIPQSTPSISLPDIINSCKRKSKPRRRIPFIPTMVKVPPSLFDYLSNEDNIKQTFLTQKTICKVPPYIPENSSIDNSPLDLSLK